MNGEFNRVKSRDYPACNPQGIFFRTGIEVIIVTVEQLREYKLTGLPRLFTDTPTPICLHSGLAD